MVNGVESGAQERDLAWSYRSGWCEQRDVSKTMERKENM